MYKEVEEAAGAAAEEEAAEAAAEEAAGGESERRREWIERAASRAVRKVPAVISKSRRELCKVQSRLDRRALPLQWRRSRWAVG